MFQKQAFADFKLGLLKNFVNSTGKNMCWSLFLIKLQAKTSATLLVRDFNTVVFLRNLQNLIKIPSLQTSFSDCFWRLTRSLEQKPVSLSAINTRFSWKKYLLPRKSRSSHRRCSVKEGLQRPAQVLSCEYCKMFKNTYFEKHLWTAASKNQDFSDKFTERSYFLNFIIPLIKAFSNLNFAMTECFFLSNIFLSKKSTHRVRCCDFFTDEIIHESVNLIQMSK